MRNLKRALSLAVASIMLLGMMVVGASATSFPDVDDSHNVEAIEVLEAVKVFVGDENGNLNPDENISRNQMAVILAKLLVGPEADNYKFGSFPFTDVPDWAKPYVAACYDSGVVAGRGAGIYDGDSTVTGQEAAAMVLRILGYTGLEGTGAAWAQPVVDKARSIGLFDGVAASATAPLIRNQVAQLAMNALETTMVNPDGTGSTIVTPDGTTVSTGGGFEDVLTSDKKVGNAFGDDPNGAGKYTVELGESLYKGDLRKETGKDDYGRPGTSWTYKGDEVTFDADYADLTYTGSVSTSDARDDLSKYTIFGGTVTIKVDGADGVTSTTINDLGEDIHDYAGKSVTVTVYVNDDKEITDVVVVNTWFGKVTRTAEKDGVTTVTISRLITGAPAASTFKTTATGVFEKDDYVVYTVGKDGDDNVIQTMALVKSMTGEITAISGTDYLRLDGDRYDFAKKNDSEDGVALGDATIYLDTNGNVVYVGKVEESAPEYLYVLAAEGYMGTISIKAMFTDGTTEIVDINTTKTVAEIGPITNPDGDNLEGNVYKYELDGSKYILSDEVEPSGDDDVTITRGSTKLTDDGITYAVTSYTVFVDVEDEKVWTGYNSVPSYTDAEVVLAEDDGVVDVVFIVDGTRIGNDDDVFYFYVTDKNKKGESFKEDNKTWYRYNTFVDGEAQEVILDASLSNTPGLYSADLIDDNGYVTDFALCIDDADPYPQTASYASKGTLTIPNDDSYAYDDDTVFVLVDGNDVSLGGVTDIILDAEPLEETTYVYVITTDDSGKTATLVYIILVDENEDYTLESESLGDDQDTTTGGINLSTKGSDNDTGEGFKDSIRAIEVAVNGNTVTASVPAASKDEADSEDENAELESFKAKVSLTRSGQEYTRSGNIGGTPLMELMMRAAIDYDTAEPDVQENFPIGEITGSYNAETGKWDVVYTIANLNLKTDAVAMEFSDFHYFDSDEDLDGPDEEYERYEYEDTYVTVSYTEESPYDISFEVQMEALLQGIEELLDGGSMEGKDDDGRGNDGVDILQLMRGTEQPYALWYGVGIPALEGATKYQLAQKVNGEYVWKGLTDVKTRGDEKVAYSYHGVAILGKTDEEGGETTWFYPNTSGITAETEADTAKPIDGDGVYEMAVRWQLENGQEKTLYYTLTRTYNLEGTT